MDILIDLSLTLFSTAGFTSEFIFCSTSESVRGVAGLPTCVGVGVPDRDTDDTGIGRNSVFKTRDDLTRGFGALTF